MNKNKVFILVSVIFMVFIFSACGATDIKERKEVEVTTQNTINSVQQQTVNEVKITAVVPEGWTAVSGSVLPVQYMKNTASFMAKEERFKSNKLSEVVEEAKEIFSKTFNNVAFQGDQESIEVDGKDATKIIFTCDIAKMQMKYMYVYVSVNDSIYTITFGDIKDSFDTLTADYDKILNQIKFE